MKHNKILKITQVSFAIFAILFGAGNILFPLQIGAIAGNKTFLALIGFFISGIGLPFLGLSSALLFHGNYQTFFYRIGKIPGWVLLFFCMLLIGPLIAIPRIISLSFELLQTIFQDLSLIWFSTIFLLLTFIGGYKRGNLIRLIGNYMGPFIFLGILLFIAIGIITTHAPTSQIVPDKSDYKIFSDAIALGYRTLDMVAILFFPSLFFTTLKTKSDEKNREDNNNLQKMVVTGCYAGTLLLGTITIGLCLLGAWYGNKFSTIPAKDIFIAIIQQLFGTASLFLVPIIIVLAAVSTVLGISAIVTEYTQNEIFKRKISYTKALALILILSFFPSNFGLKTILTISDPIIKILYPTIISLVICNTLYKVFAFEHVRLPTFIVFATVMMHHIHKFLTG